MSRQAVLTRSRSLRFLTAACVAASLVAPASASAGMFRSLSGWWPMFEGRGQLVHDLSGNGNTGTLGATPDADDHDPTWIRGWLGAALHFDGNDYIRIQDAPSLDTPNVTVSAWVRSSGSPGVNHYIISKGANPCESSGYALYTGAGKGLRFYFQDPANADLLHSSGTVAPADIWDGAWHHVAGSWDGTTARLYVDGQLVPQNADAELWLGNPITTADLGIGAFLGKCALYYAGDISQVAIFDRALPVDRLRPAFAALFPRRGR